MQRSGGNIMAVGKCQGNLMRRWEVSDLHLWDVWGLLVMCGQGLMLSGSGSHLLSRGGCDPVF